MKEILPHSASHQSTVNLSHRGSYVPQRCHHSLKQLEQLSILYEQLILRNRSLKARHRDDITGAHNIKSKGRLLEKTPFPEEVNDSVSPVQTKGTQREKQQERGTAGDILGWMHSFRDHSKTLLPECRRSEVRIKVKYNQFPSAAASLLTNKQDDQQKYSSTI